MANMTIQAAINARTQRYGLKISEISGYTYALTEDARFLVMSITYLLTQRKAANAVAEFTEAKLPFNVLYADGRDGRPMLKHNDDKKDFAYLVSVDYQIPIIVPE